MKKLLLVLGALATLSGQAMAGRTILHRYVDEQGHPRIWAEYISGVDGSDQRFPASWFKATEPKKELPISDRLHKYYEDDRSIYFNDAGAGNATVIWDKDKKQFSR